MTNKFEMWALFEQTFIEEEIKGFRAGGKVISPSGDDITAAKLTELEARLEHAREVLGRSNA